MVKRKNKPQENVINNILMFIHGYIKNINNSKVFAGLIVVVLNIASKFVTIKISKSMESYLKHTFSRDILIFCIVWMGSREIYIALGVTLVFILFMDFLLNEESYFCILPEHFIDKHKTLLEENMPSPDEIQHAQKILERAKTQPVQNVTDGSNVEIPFSGASMDNLTIKW